LVDRKVNVVYTQKVSNSLWFYLGIFLLKNKADFGLETCEIPVTLPLKIKAGGASFVCLAV
jgi:hypothetical protein